MTFTLNLDQLHELRYQDRLGDDSMLVYGRSMDDCIQTEQGQLRCHRALMVRGSNSSLTKWQALGGVGQSKVVEIVPFPGQWFDQALTELERITALSRSGQLTPAGKNRAVQLLIDTRDCLYSPRTDRIRGEANHELGPLGQLEKH